jgi:hypothetical protein
MTGLSARRSVKRKRWSVGTTPSGFAGRNGAKIGGRYAQIGERIGGSAFIERPRRAE